MRRRCEFAIAGRRGWPAVAVAPGLMVAAPREICAQQPAGSSSRAGKGRLDEVITDLKDLVSLDPILVEFSYCRAWIW